MATELYIGPDKDDVRKRLVGSICRLNGEPIYVRDSKAHVVGYYGVIDEIYKTVDYRVKEFDYRSPPLGYMNYDGQAIYVSRIPDRHNQRQGLCHDVITGTPTWPRGRWPCPEIGFCIKGSHPTLEQAIQRIDDSECESVAIHRHVAISKLNGCTLGIHYRGRLVGMRENGIYRLLQSQELSFLLHPLKKAGIPI